MREIIDILEKWTAAGAAVAVGSIVERVGSAPRDPGAALAVSSSGDIAGGVTGGCVEPALIREATEVLGGARGRLVHYGLDDEGGFEVGLNCGGQIAVAVSRLEPRDLAALGEAVRADRPVASVLCLTEPRFGEREVIVDAAAVEDARVSAAVGALLELGGCAIVESSTGGPVFVEAYAPRPRMYLFGASEHVAALVPIGKRLGYRVTVCDPRRAFLTPERFPDADELTDDWPDRFLAGATIDSRTVICMMTHDLRFEVPALAFALASPAGFIGAMGSHKVRLERTARLRALGVGEPDLARLHAPVGIQIGARTPDEVAVTIAAQLVEANVLARTRLDGAFNRATVLS
jgi:xanthine dehydrogenase accessory factor